MALPGVPNPEAPKVVSQKSLRVQLSKVMVLLAVRMTGACPVWPSPGARPARLINV